MPAHYLVIHEKNRVWLDPLTTPDRPLAEMIRYSTEWVAEFFLFDQEALARSRYEELRKEGFNVRLMSATMLSHQQKSEPIFVEGT